MNLDALYNEVTGYRGHDGDYYDKMIHPLPDVASVARVAFILDRCKGLRVLDIGSSGYLRSLLKPVCTLTGIDRAPGADICIDIEKDDLPSGDYDLILAGEIIEHLSNPGQFLDKLKKYSCPVIITTPNAYNEAARRWVTDKHMENINIEHVMWFSPTSLRVLVTRHGYRVDEFYWADGKPYISEGFIFVITKEEDNVIPQEKSA
jgi:hypothetical protein